MRLAFITDGIHWGTSDYRFLRNAMIMATACGTLCLLLVQIDGKDALTGVWVATTLWIAIRGFWGVIRVNPGIGNSPFRIGVVAKQK